MCFRLETCGAILVDANVCSPGRDKYPNLAAYHGTDVGGVTTSARTVRCQL